MSEPSPKYRSSVTRRSSLPTVESVDAVERQLQTEHHQAAVQAAKEAATATQAEPAVSKHKSDLHAQQSAFLSGNLGKQLAVFLINGVRLSGKLRQFDQFTVLLENAGEQQLIFKSAVSTVITAAR